MGIGLGIKMTNWWHRSANGPFGNHATLPSGLVSVWPLSADGSDSVGANTLTNNNTVTFVPRGPSGVVANYVVTNNEYLAKTGSETGLTNKASWSAWVKPTTLTDPRVIVAKWKYQTYGEWAFEVQSDGTLRLYVADANNSDGSITATTDSAVVTTGRFYHVVAVYDGTQANANRVKFYVNGVLAASTVAGTIPTTLLSTTNSDLLVGGFTGTLSRYFHGDAGRVGMWGAALGQAEVTSLYNSGAGKSYADLTTAEKVGLVSYWNLSEASGDRADSHGSNTLTDNNTVTSVTNAPANMPGTVANFVAASSQYLSDASTTGLDWSGDFTIGMWVNRNGTAAYHGTFAAAAVTRGYFNTGADTHVLEYATGGASATAAATNGVWHLLIMTMNATTNVGTLYVDDAAGVAGAAANTGAATTLFIGSTNTGTNPFNGKISSPMFWSRVLTAGERTALYNSGDGLFY